MTTPTDAYVAHRQAQLEAAIAAREGAAVVAVIDLIAADGYPELAGRLQRSLIEQGLDNLAARTAMSNPNHHH